MGRKLTDLKGKIFGRWLVLNEVERDKHNARQWLCECQCGKGVQKVISQNSLRQGKSKSCGCLKSEITIAFNKNNKKKVNNYNLDGDFGIGYTTNTNAEFYFDLEDYEKIKAHSWAEHHKGYICTNIDNKFVSLHRFIKNPKNDKVIDHNNRNKKDNRKNNLEECIQHKNMLNQGVRKNNSSGINGVTWNKQKSKWHSYIMINKKLKHLGYYENLNDAIKVRLKAEKDNGYSGENTKLWSKYNI